MPKNLEVKARISSIERAISVAKSLPARYDGELHQVDTYFNVTYGRLKLREINNHYAELICYKRIEDTNQRVSDFEIYPSHDSPRLKRILEQSIGLQAIVAKKRSLFIYNTTRIHIDEVERSGSFLELETPFGLSEDAAKKATEYLIRKFEVRENDYVLHSYLDLIVAKN